MPISVLTTGDDLRDYEHFVAHHGCSAFYHRAEWIRILEKTYRYPARIVVVRGEAGLEGALPLFLVRPWMGQRRLVCMPFSHHVGPLVEGAGALEALLEGALDLAKTLRCDHVLLKNSVHSEQLIPVGGKTIAPFQQSVLGLDCGSEELFERFSSSTRRAVRKARKAKLSVVNRTDAEAFRVFKRLTAITRRRQGSPTYPTSFFPILHQELGDSPYVRLYLAEAESQYVAGIVVFHHGTTAIYAYGASLNNRELLRLRPNNLLFDTAIRDAAQAGLERFDFGTTPAANQNLLRFKEGWGATTEELDYTVLPIGTANISTLSRESPLVRLASRVFKRLPMPLFERVSSLAIRQVG